MSDTGTHTLRRGLALVLLALASTSAHAIPSPDLIINLSASVAQLLGLLSVVFGGFALSGKKKLAAARRRGFGRGAQVLLGVVALGLLGSLAANVLQYTSAVDERNTRLHTNLVRKSVENGQAVGDVSLKTLSFSDQLDHEQGISTETLAAWLGEDKPLTIIDVRENEEHEAGAIEGAAHLRYPDVLSHASSLPDSGEGTTLLMCFSGNRSSELCGELEAMGKACNFLVGGYEKWLSESRPLAEGVEIDANELRQIPTFRNKDVLLDTPKVQELVNAEGAEFVDVRYPEDFIADHLPGAHNITMRALSSAALTQKIEALPDVPIIAPCYDKRSCFYGQLIGLRLERAGRDFRGRYSVPHEYYAPSPGGSERAHVAAWRSEREQLTLASYVVTPLRNALDGLTASTGHYALALLVLVVLIRLALFPLALKAERDTRVQKSLANRVDALREELGEHPRALAEATFALYREHRIRPVVNTLSSVLQLGLLLLFYAAVTEGAPNWNQPFLWLESAAAPDPYLIVPLLASVLFALVLVTQWTPKTRRGRLLLGLGCTALFWLLHGLGAAVNLYLAISMGFLVLQGLALDMLGRKLGWDTRGGTAAAPVDDGFVPLAAAHRLPAVTGKKAERLGMLLEAGHDVPAGFVVTERVTRRIRPNESGPLFDAGEHRRLDALWKSIGGGPVAVRSSGTSEDGEEASFAGVYESILNVTREGFEAAVREVYASLDSSRASAYAERSGERVDSGAGGSRGGIVVQQMVPAEYAGVMFTEHPGTSGAMMIELVRGLGEELVGGTVTPDTFTFGKLTGTRIVDGANEPEPPIDLGPLLALGRDLERHFGQPQDIEWAWTKGEFVLLQARDITRSITLGDTPRNLAERERARLVKQLLGRRRVARREESVDPAEPVFVQNELSELLPRPTPLSVDLMSRLWASDGSTDLACRELGIPYEVHPHSTPYLVTVFGWTYVNRHEERRRLGKGPGALATFHLARDAEETARAFRDDFLPRFRAEMVERNAIALDRLELDTALALLESWVERFVTATYVQAERINIAADFHLKTALGKLEGAKLDPASWLGDTGETVVSRAMAHISGETVTAADVETFLLAFGHRAPLDYELSAPRFDEDMELVRQYIERSQGTRKGASEASSTADPDANLPEEKVLRVSVRRAREFMRLKEEAKHYCLIELAQIRHLLLAIDARAGLDGNVFQLGFEEIASLEDSERRDTLLVLAEARRAEARLAEPLQPPPTLSMDDLERIDLVTGQRPDVATDGELVGKRVAGEQTVTARVRVIVDVSGIDEFEEGEILVARMTDPTWYPLFAKARGIVTEIGGWLSHAAIVAREYDLPAIVGVGGACRTLATGDVVTLHPDGSVERVEERRDPDSPLRGAGGTAGTSAVAPGPAPDGLGTMPATGSVVLDGGERFARVAERRAAKGRLDDRRRALRPSATGEPEPDRRRAERLENARRAYRRAS